VRRQPELQVSAAAEDLTRAKPRLPRVPFVAEADEVTWRTLSVFCTYRVVLAIFVSSAFVFLNRFFNLGVMAPEVMVPTLATYTLVSIALIVPARMREPSLVIQVTAGVFLDVLAIVMLMYASGGVRSGLGVVLLVSLAAAGLITRGRLAYFHAATAALAVLLEQTFQLWRHDAGPQEFLQAGITAGAFFATAGLASALARYARTSEQIAAERGVDLANLSEINEIVIRDMQDGIPRGRRRRTHPPAQSAGRAADGAAAARQAAAARRLRARGGDPAGRLAQGFGRAVRAAAHAARRQRASGALRAHRRGQPRAHRRFLRGHRPHARAGAADEARGPGAAHRVDRTRDPQPAFLDRPPRRT
jgi:hypothetical protein